VESSARTRKLIIVKELPTTLTAKPKELFNFLQGTLPLLTAFLVFSLTKIESSYELNPYRLFPEETLRQLKIHHIKFNAIPPTVMTKKVNYWIECLKIPKNASFTKSIVEKADGDIRSAMLLLEMSFFEQTTRQSGLLVLYGFSAYFIPLFGQDLLRETIGNR